MFATMKKGMSYSYRYGLEYKQDTPFDTKMDYNYADKSHDTYYNASENTSHFFTGQAAYGE